ncbi:hypothetical protein QZH41_001384 [Actinostola sp. cb2023]|nr:hypothetical protein QZH41_001384 [Actinostola sp. cb2023]
MAILEARRKEEIANAKLEAIEYAFSEEDLRDRTHRLPAVPLARNRTNEWVYEGQHATQTSPTDGEPRRVPPPRPSGIAPPIRTGSLARDLYHPHERVGGQPFFASTPMRDITGSQLIETLTATNQQIVSGLARQNLPKCHPDTFIGDATLFHPWKKAFKAMIRDTEVSPEQEVNYLRKFTSGDVQRVVDNFRKRQQSDPASLLQSLWLELERRFGSSAVITNALLERLHESAAFSESDTVKLQEFADVCADVDSQVAYLPGLACLNFPNAIRPIVEKLPISLRSKWEKEIVRYAEKNDDAYPDFHSFTRTIQSQAKLRNHPNIIAGSKTANRPRDKPDHRRALVTTTTRPEEPRADTSAEGKYCPFHERDGHDLVECKSFKSKSLKDKTDWILKAGLCFLCLSHAHQAKDCTSRPSCDICGDTRYIALLHKERATQPPPGEANEAEEVNSKCTAVCRERKGGVSCSKIVLVDVSVKARQNTSKRVYAIIDDQSNTSLISSELADALGADGPTEKYLLSTCSSSDQVKYGRRVSGLIVRSIQNGNESELPTLVECDGIPEDKTEIPTPELARRFAHLRDIADEIPPADSSASIHILLGRDAPELLKVRAFKNGPRGAPWAQKLLLGWTVSGQACLDHVNGPVHIQARQTKVSGEKEKSMNVIQTGNQGEPSPDGEEYDIIPCPNKIKLTDSLTQRYTESLKDDVFHTERSDNEVSLSCEDRKFLEIMEDGIHKNDSGNWEMPLPFRRQDVSMPNNRTQAEHRLNSLLKTLRRKPQMEKDYVEFMEKIIHKGHASPVPEVNASAGQVWYLPHFGVYHPKKPTQIRVVFDSSAEFGGISLNKELLSGPDLMNSLLGVLIRFRRESVGVMCDIEQMFHSFHVDPKHRNFLRFLWFQDNDPHKAVIDYRMNVHLFGNGPSPAVATFGLRKTASSHGEEISGEEVESFVNRNFYVDDGLASLSTPKQAIDLVSKAQAVLATSNLRLHKVVSNSIEVVEAFPTTDRAKDLRDLDLHQDSLPAQRSLGVYWDLERDTFTFRVALQEKPFTRRGVLSIVNSVYDPLGLAAPVMIDGKKILQQLVAMGKRTNDHAPLGWDDPLPEKFLNRWQGWKDDLLNLEGVSVPRCYRPKEFGAARRAELHAFSDASQDAVAAAVYLRIFNENNDVTVTLVYGQAKVAPVRSTSIPRLELCGAVMATQAVAKVLKEIDLEIAEVVYYTDSQVVLGYITNESRRFYVYVANRVQAIRSLTSPDQWRYVESAKNPADPATRGVRADNLSDSIWLNGPDFLKDSSEIPSFKETDVSGSDPEVRKEVFVCKTKLKEAKRQGLGTDRFKDSRALHRYVVASLY